MNITKAHLCRDVSKKVGIPMTKVKPVVESLLASIICETAKGNRIELRGFGVFDSKQNSARVGRNPRTGEQVRIEPAIRPTFKFSRDAQNTFERLRG